MHRPLLYGPAFALVKGVPGCVLLEAPKCSPASGSAARDHRAMARNNAEPIPCPFIPVLTCRLSTRLPQRSSSPPNAHTKPINSPSRSVKTTFLASAGETSKLGACRVRPAGQKIGIDDVTVRAPPAFHVDQHNRSNILRRCVPHLHAASPIPRNWACLVLLKCVRSTPSIGPGPSLRSSIVLH